MLQAIRDSFLRWVGGILLLLIAIAFVFWGVRPDMGGGAASYAAKVNGEEISLAAFDRELQYQQSQYADLYKAQLTEELRRQLRRNVVEQLVRNRALQQHVDDIGYGVSDDRVSASIRNMAAFQVGGEFSLDLYRSQLLNEGLSPTTFESQQRQRLKLVDLQNGLADSAFFTPAEFRRYIELYGESRELGYALFTVDSFLGDVEVTDEEIASHYEANKDQYRSEETVDLEYIELKQADIAASLDVSDEALRKYYEDQKDRFQTQEERHASHILITIEGDDDAAAKAKAEAALARVNNGEDFAAVARDVSEDTGTKDKGGDLGWISRGMLAGPFEDALFSMQPGEVKGPIKTQFGYHIIKLEEIKPAEQQSFDSVRDQLVQEYREQQAGDIFYDRANELADHAFDAYDELASVADQMNLPLKKLAAFPRSGDADVFSNSAPVVQAAFSPEVLEQGQNSGLIKLSDDDVLVLRDAAHHPAEQLPLDAVRDTVVQELKRARAEQQASAATGEFLADAQAAAADADMAALATQHRGEWHEPQSITRTTADVPTEILAAAFRMPKPEDNAVTRQRIGLANGDDAVLVLSGVKLGDPAAVVAQQREQRLKQLGEQSGMYDLAAYAETVTDKATVSVPDEILNPPTSY